ncbi:TolC family protein [Clostridium chromiireducens]|uniref:TolC family protein n=1 Tax=Clostridium chromiireducens TaxID=225345 RepID=A0A964RKJ2_9CLOT|nr:TolC family protein [Clostridium chromiireducens]MVX63448.1 TolC family protein [Clostridium chromiireducens]
MRKNVNKLVALAIGISIISGSIIPAFAADTTQQVSVTTTGAQIANGKPLLTLDDAIKAAISNSETLALDDKKISYQDKTNDINEELDDYNNVSGDKEDFNDDTRDINLKKLKQQRDFDEDVLRQKVITKYNSIVTSQMKINKSAKALELKNKDLSDAKFKENLGMITSTSFKSTELDIKNLQITQKASESALQNAKDSFKVLTGIDVDKYSLEQDIPYETLKIDGSIDEYLDDVINKYVEYSEQLIKLNKDYYNDKDNKVNASIVSDAKTITDTAKANGEPKFTDSKYDIALYSNYNEAYKAYKDDHDKYESEINAYANAISARLTYLSTKLSIDQNQTSLNESKKQFKEQLKTFYTNLITQEETINYLNQSIELNNKKLSDAKLKYDLGMITESAYNTQVVSSRDLDLQLRDGIDTYNTLKEKIQKPWIAFSN